MGESGSQGRKYRINWDERDDAFWDDSREIIVVGRITDPAHDYQCRTCCELFEVRYRRDEKPLAVLCPVCGSGDTGRMIATFPLTRIWWADARSSVDAAQMKPRWLGSVSKGR